MAATLTTQLVPQYHAQFGFQLDRHREPPKSSKSFGLISVYHEWDLLATQMVKIARYHLS